LNPGGPPGIELMEAELLHYATGEEIQIGDRVQYDGVLATVVVVSDGETYQVAPGYEDYAGVERGVTICDDDGGLNTVSETDARLTFEERGTA